MMLLRCWIRPALHAHNHSLEDTVVERLLGISIYMHFFFERDCLFTWTAYLIATSAQLDAEQVWARRRPGHKQRLDNSHEDSWCDPPGSFLECLSLAERSRYNVYTSMFPGEVADVGQDPRSRPLHSSQGKLGTLVKGQGLMMLPVSLKADSFPIRWFAIVELLTSMGFPITPSIVKACHGATCGFSEGHASPSSRSRASAAQQIGNTMHVNFIGGLTMLLIAKPPFLGNPIPNTGHFAEQPLDADVATHCLRKGNGRYGPTQATRKRRD